MHRTLGAVLAAFLLVCSSTPALADDVSAVVTPIGLQVNTLPGDTFLIYHGRLFVKTAEGALDEYRWGGTACGSRVLTEPQVAALQAALDNNKMRLQILYQIGQGDSKCVVGFTAMPKSAVKLVLP